jgi:chromatin structure-remodeling complex subunit RSC9
VHHAQHQQRISAHTPDAALLHEGPRNRLWLSLRSGIDAEVDYALPLLVLASHDRLDAFNLDRWVDPVQALREWPDKWVDDLEREAAYRQLQAGPSASSSASDSTSGSSEALGAVPAWTRSPTTELRAAFSLQIFRNASFSDRNVAELVKARFGSFLDRFFALPTNFLVELATRSPEPIQHILVILQNISPRLGVDASILHVLGTVLPTLAMNLADAGMLLFLLPILIRAFSSPALSLLPAPEGFVQHVLYFLTLSPPAPLLDYVLDLLAVLATSPSHARTILADPSFPGHLKALTLLLEHGARAENALWNPAGPFRAMPVPNPASVDVMARGASARRLTERESDRERMEGSGGAGVFREVGDKQPELPLSLKTELYAMNEPKRSITW